MNTVDTEQDIIKDDDQQLKMSAGNQAFLASLLPMSQQRWDGPTVTPKEPKTIYKHIFHCTTT